MAGATDAPLRIELPPPSGSPEPRGETPYWRLVRVLWRTEHGGWQHVQAWRVTAASETGCALLGYPSADGAGAATSTDSTGDGAVTDWAPTVADRAEAVSKHQPSPLGGREG